MVRIKQKATEIFKKDFAYYLFKSKFEFYFLLYSPLMFFVSIYAYVISKTFNNILPIHSLWSLNVITAITWGFYIYYVRRHKLKKQNTTSEKLSNQVLDRNYKEAVGSILAGDKNDLKQIDNLIERFKPENIKFENRPSYKKLINWFLSKLDLKAIAITIAAFILFSSKYTFQKTLCGSIAILFLLFFFLFFYQQIVDLFYKKEALSITIVEKLKDLKANLEMEYRDYA